MPDNTLPKKPVTVEALSGFAEGTSTVAQFADDALRAYDRGDMAALRDHLLGVRMTAAT